MVLNLGRILAIKPTEVSDTHRTVWRWSVIENVEATVNLSNTKVKN